MSDDEQKPMELQELNSAAESEEAAGQVPDTTEAAAAADADPEEITRAASDLEAVFDVPVVVSAILGKTDMEVSELLHLNKGAVVELDRKIGEAIDIYVNDRLVARGEVVIMDERLGITMTEIIKGHRN